MIRKGKDCYRRKMEHQLQQNNICGVWKGLKTISGFKEPKSQPVGDQGWANDLNLFFNRFDQASAPPLPSPVSSAATSITLCAPCPLLLLCPLTPSHDPQFTPTLSTLPPLHTASVLHCTSPPSTPPCSSLLLTTHQVRNALKKNRARKAAGPDGISSRLLKSCADQLCGIFGGTFWVHIQPEPEAGESATALEDVLHRPSAKDTAPQGAQQLQAGSSDVSSDEDAGETGPRPICAQLVSSFMDPLQFAYQPDIANGWMMPSLLSSTSFTPPSLTWRRPGSTVRIMFFDFSSAFNTIQPRLLGDKLQLAGTSSYNTPSCHLQKFSDDSAVVGLITDGDDREYRGLIQDFADWCLRNNLQINAGKTKELVVDFRRRSHSPPAPVSIQGMDIDTVKSYKYLGVHLNDSLDLVGQH
ncbi:hypothetical protein L3Q82_004738 [Scortum barcoo]|uniref:Uncharacterized protein n=1 Tax=Scortum barcoo TaxID=214431 RepID=A0ACB8VHT4_9TELE|nr:hypothetical protein L3Q82_004738 [Scortum barcoo]